MAAHQPAKRTFSAAAAEGETAKLGDLELFLVEVPRNDPWPPVRSLLVRLASDAGVEGWGETRAIWRASELAARRDTLLPALAGRSPFDIEELLELDVLATPALRCAVEMAAWDLVGRMVGQPLCHLWGGMYRQRIPLAVRLSSEPDHLPQEARELAEQGLHTQIVTATGQEQLDRQTLSAVRTAAGDRAEICFDGRRQFDPETARDMCRDLEQEGLRWFLDPLQGGKLAELAALRRQTTVPLAVSIAESGPRDVMNVVRAGAAPAIVVDPQAVGGLLPTRKCAVVAEAAGLSASLGGAPALGIAVAALLHVAAATPAFTSGNELAYHQLRDDVLTRPLEIVDGMLAVPQRPGLGIDVDRTRLERHMLA